MKKTLLLLILFKTLLLTAQKEANVWYFGRNAGLDFNTTPPTALTDGELNTLEGCSSFSDENGNLLFYSDGITVWDKNHNIMSFSDGTISGFGGRELLGNPSSTQSGMIIPLPKSNDIYFLFTVDDNSGSSGLNYYTIDMSQNGGNGEITNGPVNLSGTLGANWTEKVAAVRGTDCDTYWVVSAVGSDFYAYKIDDTGVQDTTPVISNTFGNAGLRGYLKLSPDGTKLAVANQGSRDAFLFDFNATNGRVSSSPESLINNFNDGEPYGLEFSVDSRKLYVSTVSEFRGDLTEPETTYKLFQFDLNAADIRTSQALIHEQTPGFRGGLQLGPDSKIYATIPLAYDDTRGDAQFLDVIENPTADAADVVFTKNAINLNGQLATQGLPPFIASLLLPIEITNNTTNLVLNNTEQKACIGDNISITPEDISAQSSGTISYEWVHDNGTTETIVSTNMTLDLVNLQFTHTGRYTLKVSLTDNCNNPVKREATFELEVFETAVATQPTDIFFCDVDNDGFNTFDLANTTTPQILNGLNPADFQVNYYLTQAEADANAGGELTLPYTNLTPFSNQTIVARIHNIAAPDACFDTTSFTLAVTGQPVAQTPVDYEQCDDTANGGDTDGFFNNFILNTKDIEILGTLDPAIYNVSYHTSLTGAQTSNATDVINKNTPYRNINANNQTVFVRVENRNNVACNDTTVSFNLIVNPLPIVATSVDLRQCDVNPDLISNINLTLAQQNLSGNHANETFRYYTSLNGAVNNTGEITTPTAHSLTNGDTVWVRIISDKGCYRISSINIIIGYSADVAYNQEFAVCDDFLDIDGNDTANNDDTDGITTFDISSVVPDVRALFPAAIQPNLDVLIFETIADRDAVLNAIPAADLATYRNRNVPAVTPQPLYIKIINTVNNDCTGLGTFNIWAQQPPMANTPTDVNECDDFDSGSFIDGITNHIDLTPQINNALGTQNPANFTVTLHHTATDANTGANPIANTNDYTNITPNRETIFVRIQNNATGCFNDHQSFDIIINPIPNINNAITPIEVCDVETLADADTRNRLAQDIDLSVRDAEILAGRDATQFVVSYHKSRQDAIDGIRPVNKLSYSNDVATTNFPANLDSDDPGTEIIFVSLLNTATQCRNGITTLELRIFPEPNLPANINPYTDCDNLSDGSDTNGINGDITLSSKIPEILSEYPAADHNNYTVTFHDELIDAQNGDDPLDANVYQNTANNQTIYVRVVNNITQCINDSLSFNIIINPLPQFDVDTPVIVCLDNTSTTLDTPGLRLEALNPAATYDYTWYNEADLTTPIGGNEPFLDITAGGNYRVVAKMTDGTECERQETIVVNESISPTLEREDIVIEDDTNNNRLDRYSIKVITENNNLGIGDYQFALHNHESNTTSPFQDEPLFNDIRGGIYTVIVNDKDGCEPDATLEVSVIEYPKFLTPNNDGVNDTWKIKGANSSFYPESNIHVFDRYGKIVAIIPIDTEGWNGTYKGKTLPETDYWFKVMLVDRQGNQHLHQGHFSLILR